MYYNNWGCTIKTNMIRVIIGDDPFSISSMTYDENRYEEFLTEKLIKLERLFFPHISAFFDLPEIIEEGDKDLIPAGLRTIGICFRERINIIRSPIKHYRQKCRFCVLDRSDIGDGLCLH